MNTYVKKSSKGREKEPKKETIQFLLNYSKSLKVVKDKKDRCIEMNLN